MHQDIDQLILSLTYFVRFYHQCRMFFFLKDLGQFSFARDAAVATDDIVDVGPVFGE